MNSLPRPDDICEFEGEPISDIILCGRLLRRIEEPMRTQFEINDNTGTFYVLFYHKGENQVPTALRNFNYEQFCYVKIYGTIRVFKEEKAIVGTHIKRIEQFDEMTNHFLSTYVAHCIRKKGVLKPRELAIDPQALDNIMTDSNGQQAQKSQITQEELRKTVLNLIREMSKTTQIIHKNSIFGMVQNRTERDSFEKEITRMLNDGVVCLGHDNDHLCLVDE